MKEPAKDGASNPVAHAENSGNGVRASRQVVRKQAQEKPNGLANGMKRLRATIEASVDCVITIDANSTILEFNAAAERTFGYAREEVIGKPLTETIIPPSLREAHLKGMAALMKGGPAKLLGRRVEMPAMRADSTEFPIELTITRIDSEDPPLFTAYLRDITERKRAEEALRKSEKLFTAFMDHLPGYAWIKDVEGRYVYINETFLQLRNAVGKTDAELWPAEVASTYRANDNQVIQTRNALQTIEPFPKDPEQGCQIVSKFPIFDQQGAVVMVGGASVDISALIQAEKALEVQALRYKTLMETSTDSIYVVDAEGNLLEANAAFLRQRGYTAAEVKGLNVADWDARWTPAQLQKRLRKLADSSDVFETRHRCKDGSLFDVEVNAASVRIGGKQLFFCVTRDITGRKKAERALRESETRFRQLVENLNEVFWINDVDGSSVYVSPAYERIWGRSCESFYAEPKSWRDAIHPEDRPRLEATFAADPALTEDNTYRIVHADGSIRWIRDRGFPVRNEKGQVMRFAGIAEDITATKCVEEELQQANTQLRVLSRRLFEVRDEERRHLARELHDEIGQALTAAKINVSSVQAAKNGDHSLRLQETMALLDNLLRQVRQISLDLHPSLLDDLGLAAALRSLLDQQARRAGLRAQFCAAQLADNIGPAIETTAFRIAQEAITNILRHANAGFVSVHLRTETGALRMKIVDDGRGFDLAEVEGHTGPVRGFGLMGMRERAASVGGRVQIVSSPKKGTTVEVFLPLNGSGHGQSG
jgi:PAS domain S-box-containing protein